MIDYFFYNFMIDEDTNSDDKNMTKKARPVSLLFFLLLYVVTSISPIATSI